MPQPDLQTLRLRATRQLEASLARATADAQLHEAMGYSLLSGGKRIRPLLVYATHLALGGDLALADPAAAAVELVHTYSLVHDDLPAIDDDDLRRGQATSHKRFGEATAILVGDALQSLAFEVLANSANPEALRQVGILSRAIGPSGMVAGQMADLRATGVSVSAAELEQLHLRKTGALIEASVLLGACGCRASADVQQALADYARQLGLAFQVKDDLLDATGDVERMGKHAGADERLGKTTYVSLYGIAGAAERLRTLHAGSREALNRVPGQTRLLAEIADFTADRDH